jgi:hypothetical protein
LKQARKTRKNMSVNIEKTGTVEVTECSVCFLQADSYASLKKHWMKHLSPSENESEEDEEMTLGTEELECDRKKQKTPNIKVKKCPHCEYVTCQSRALVRHIKNVHNKLKDMKCSECEFASNNKHHLLQHIKAVHDKIKDIKC